MDIKNPTSLTITSVGVVVTGTGALLGGKTGAAIAGFGLAHVALGLMDNFRPTVKQNSEQQLPHSY